MSNTFGITADEIRDLTLRNLQISNSAAIAELKIAFDTLAGHNHDGSNSRLVSSGGNAYQSQVSFTGSVNGTNVTFTLASNFLANTVSVYVDGIRQARSSHFTESPPNQIVFALAPLTGSTLIFDCITT